MLLFIAWPNLADSQKQKDKRQSTSNL